MPDVPRISVPGPASKPARLAALVSGSGTTMQNLAAKIEAGQLDAEVALCIASNDKAYGIERAKELGVPCRVIRRKDHESTATFSEAIFAAIREAQIDYVCLAGFLSLLQIPDDYAMRVLNIHPALLPAFGGKGMHGGHVHAAVLEHGCKVSGCTVHFADQTYDTGPILVQRACPVLPDDTPETLAARVFEEECEAYPEALRKLIAGDCIIEGRCTC